MKKWTVLLIALIISTTAMASEGWLTDFATAQKEATARQVPILVDFSGSDWCGWCIRLDQEVFSKPAFKEYADKNLVLLLLDFPRKSKLSPGMQAQNQELSQKYGVRGFPTVLLLNADGRVLGRTGYQRGGAEAYVKHIQELLGSAISETK